LRENPVEGTVQYPNIYKVFTSQVMHFSPKKTTIQAKSRGHIFGFVISAMMQVPKIWTRKWWWQLIVIFFPWDPSHPSKITHKTPPSKRLNTIFIRGNPSNLNRNSPEIGQEYKNLYWLVV